MSHLHKRHAAHAKRTARVRRRIKKAVGDRARLNVFRSNSHIYAQLIDDATGKTLAAASTLSASFKEQGSASNKTEAAKKVGELIGKIAIEKGIDKAVFDRGGYLYHGRVKALADGAREAGLKF